MQMKLWSFLSFSLTFLYHSFSQGLKKQPTPIPLFSLSRHIYHDFIIINYLDNYLTYVLIRPKQKALGFRLFFLYCSFHFPHTMLFWLIIFSSKTIFYSNQLISVPRLLTCGKQPKKVKQNQSKKQTNKQNESLLGIKPLRDYLYVLFQWWKSIVYCLFSRPNQETQSRCQLWSNGCAHITVSSISVCVRVRAQCDPTAQQHWPLLETACLRLWSIYTEPTVPSLHNIRKWKQMSLSFSHSLHSILLSLSIYLMHTHTWTSGLCVHILYIA